MSKQRLSLARVVLNCYIAARSGKTEVLMRELVHVMGEREGGGVVWVVHDLIKIANHCDSRVLLHLDAEDLCLCYCQLHLKLRHLVLQVRYCPHTAIDRVSHSCICFVD